MRYKRWSLLVRQLQLQRQTSIDIVDRWWHKVPEPKKTIKDKIPNEN